MNPEWSDPMLGAFDHIGVVVKSLQLGRRHLENILDVREWTQEYDDPINRVRIVFGRDPSGMVHELLEPLGEGSPIAASLREKRNLLNHVAYRVESLERSAAFLRGKGCIPTGHPSKAIAFGSGQVQFFLTPLNIIYEIIESPDHKHHFL